MVFWFEDAPSFFVQITPVLPPDLVFLQPQKGAGIQW